ncbi:hypothetical protein GWK47_003184 [Chionoecetes opilio]|uniref:Uncharacterized protein n=1 Tax=Chionoecetes opilio TaxID=41210 RepID=A0A8J8WA25_CHIOP|nr:hypothetical protein GWK47_003184 [Chionoecetes opilio]
MEYSPLAWSSCPPSYLGLLDRVQAIVQRLARLKAPEAAAQIIQPLQQRRDVAGMCVMYKVHRMQLLQLAELRLNPLARPSHSTRAAHNIDHQVTVPLARTEHYLRYFLPRYGRLWNTLVHQTDLHLTTFLHAFKSGLWAAKLDLPDELELQAVDGVDHGGHPDGTHKDGVHAVLEVEVDHLNGTHEAANGVHTFRAALLRRSKGMLATLDTKNARSSLEERGRVWGEKRKGEGGRDKGVSGRECFLSEKRETSLGRGLSGRECKRGFRNSLPVQALHVRPSCSNGDDVLQNCGHTLKGLHSAHSCKHPLLWVISTSTLSRGSLTSSDRFFGTHQSRRLPTHISGSSFDPVPDLPCSIVTCRPLAIVGSSDHLVVLTKIKLAIDRDEAVTSTNWLWDKGDWDAMKATLTTLCGLTCLKVTLTHN